MQKQKLKVEIEVWGIEVEETAHYENGNGSGWYKFEYSIRVNGGKKKYGEIDGSWSSQTRAHFRRVLGRGHAAKQVLETLV
jgi:hypothetical protein